jgi:hypothetical protein
MNQNYTPRPLRPNPLRLGVNIDHVATIRNARGGDHPDPVRAAQIVAAVGGDGITAHLREDRRHIRDADIERIMAATHLPLNLEMAATEEMLEIALRHKPHAACIVPERREERTTEGGLDVAGQEAQAGGAAGRAGGQGRSQVAEGQLLNTAATGQQAAGEQAAAAADLQHPPERPAAMPLQQVEQPLRRLPLRKRLRL